MPSLPTGTVTFLFTDIEGSTMLLQRLSSPFEYHTRGAGMAIAERHLA